MNITVNSLGQIEPTSCGRDYVQRMRRMMADASQAPSIFHPGPFWKPHADRMVAAIERHGIENFRRIPEKALSAFNTGNHWRPAQTRMFRLCQGAARIPLLGRAARMVIRDIEGGYARAKSESNFKLRAVYHWLRETAPDLIDLRDKLVGNPITFTIDGRDYSEIFLLKLLDLSLLRKHVDFSTVRSVIEIGGSYGLLGEIILRRYPQISYTLVDIAPVAAFAEYYLAQTVGRSNRIKVLCAHDLPAISDRFDLFINVGSFQEMSREQVRMYCDFASHAAGAVYLNNNHYSPQNEMTSADYESMIRMTVTERWSNPLSANYRPTLFEAEDRGTLSQRS